MQMPEGWKRLKKTAHFLDMEDMLDLMKEMAEALEISVGPILCEYTDQDCIHIADKIETVLKKFKEWR